MRLQIYMALAIMASILWACKSVNSQGNNENEVSMNNNSDSEGEVVMEINHHRSTCVGEGSMMCLLAKEEGQADWEFFYEVIEGFDYEWGYIYEIQVQKSMVKNPPADGSSLAYKWIKTISKKEAPENETFTISYDSNLILEESKSFSVLGGPAISFTSDPVKADFLNFKQKERPFEMTFRHAQKGNIELVKVNR